MRVTTHVALYEKQVREALERLTDDFMFRLSEKDAAYQQLMEKAVRFAAALYDPNVQVMDDPLYEEAQAFLKEQQS